MQMLKCSASGGLRTQTLPHWGSFAPGPHWGVPSPDPYFRPPGKNYQSSTGPSGVGEKGYKFFYSFHFFGAPGVPGSKFTSLSGDVQQGPSIQLLNFVPSRRYLLPKFVDFGDGATNKQIQTVKGKIIAWAPVTLY